MSNRIQPIGINTRPTLQRPLTSLARAAVIASSALLSSVGISHTSEAQTPTTISQNIAPLAAQVVLSQTEESPFSQELRDFIKEGFSTSVGLLAIDPGYIVTEADKEFAKQNSRTYFALGITQNPNFNITEADSTFARTNPDTHFAYGLAHNPQYTIEAEDKAIMRHEVGFRTLFTEGLVQNPNLVVEAEDKEVARKHPTSSFTDFIVQNPTYTAEAEDKQVARENPGTLFAYSLTGKSDYQVEKIDRQTVRADLNTMFAHLASNPNYLKEIEQEEDVKIALQNPDTIFAPELLSNPALQLTPELITLAKSVEYVDTALAEGITLNPNYPITEENIQFAKDKSDTSYAAGLTSNPNFPMTEENIKFAMENLNSSFAFGVGLNPNFPLTKEVLSKIPPRSSFARGLSMHPDIDKVALELFQSKVEEMLASVAPPSDTQSTSTIPAVTDATFEKEVLQSDIPVLVDFWADWCGPCKTIAPRVEEIAKDYEGKLKVLKLDIDENPQATKDYNITGIPCLIVFKDGKEVGRILGAVPKSEISKVVEEHV